MAQVGGEGKGVGTNTLVLRLKLSTAKFCISIGMTFVVSTSLGVEFLPTGKFLGILLYGKSNLLRLGKRHAALLHSRRVAILQRRIVITEVLLTIAHSCDKLLAIRSGG